MMKKRPEEKGKNGKKFKERETGYRKRLMKKMRKREKRVT